MPNTKRYQQIAAGFKNTRLGQELQKVAKMKLPNFGLTLRVSRDNPTPDDILVFTAKESRTPKSLFFKKKAKYEKGDIIIKKRGSKGYMAIRSDGTVFVSKGWRDDSRKMERVVDALTAPHRSQAIMDSISDSSFIASSEKLFNSLKPFLTNQNPVFLERHIDSKIYNARDAIVKSLWEAAKQDFDNNRLSGEFEGSRVCQVARRYVRQAGMGPEELEYRRQLEWAMRDSTGQPTRRAAVPPPYGAEPPAYPDPPTYSPGPPSYDATMARDAERREVERRIREEGVTRVQVAPGPRLRSRPSSQPTQPQGRTVVLNGKEIHNVVDL